MENVLGYIYSWFESLYGYNLGNYLWGLDCNNQYTNPTLFNNIGIVALLISIGVAVVYYFVINSPKLVSWWQWLIVLFIDGLINFVVGFSWMMNDLKTGKIPDCFVYSAQDGAQLIDSVNCIGFGMVNFIISASLFFIISFVIKRFSRNLSNTPFVSLFPKK